MNDDFLNRRLEDRREQHLLRELKLPANGLVDFCSNDYLGIAKNKLLSQQGEATSLNYGATGSRLLSGNSDLAEEAESFIAGFHDAGAGLLFNSGYDANVGLLSSVPQRGDTIIYDFLSHASIRDGARLSFARSYSFNHNDVNDLEDKLKQASGNIFVVTESVFSMDGDLCPLDDIVVCCEKYGAHVIVDEAHATGIIGAKGEGLVQMLGFSERVFARVHTFGKACGVHGAIILGSARLKSYLVNFARSFVYTTALPPQAVAHILASYRLFPAMVAERLQLAHLTRFFQEERTGVKGQGHNTPIQVIIVPGNEQARLVAGTLRNTGLDVRPILYPTVPKGSERLRVVLHSFNTVEQVRILLNSLKNSL